MKRTDPQSRKRLWLCCEVVLLMLMFVPARMVHADCTVTNLGISPLPDLGWGAYKNMLGGLYPNGSNARPADHEAAGVEIATTQGYAA